MPEQILEDLQIHWEGTCCNIQLRRALPEGEWILRHRRHGIVHPFCAAASSNGIQIRSFDFGEQVLEAGLWDVFIQTDSTSRTALSRVQLDSDEDWESHVLESVDSLWYVRPYRTLDCELSFQIGHGSQRVIPVEAVYWHSESILEVHALLLGDYKVTGVFTRKGGVETKLSLERENNSLIFRVDLGDFEWDSSEESDLEFFWKVESSKDGILHVPVGAKIDESFDTARIWKLPGTQIVKDEIAIWLLPEFGKNDELRVRQVVPIRTIVDSIDTHRWHSLGVVDLDLRLEIDRSCGWFGGIGIKEMEISGAVAFLKEDEKEIPLGDFRVEGVGDSMQLRVDIRKLSAISKTAVCKAFIRVTVGGQTIDLPILDTNSLVAAHTFKAGAVKDRGRQYRSFYRDSNSGRINIEFRPFRHKEKFTTKLMDAAALVLAEVAAPFAKTETWLVGENLGHVAQDNGYAFFEHCMEEQKEQNIYYIARSSNRHLDKLAKYQSNVIRYNSFTHYYRYHLAKKLIVAHGIRDVLPSSKHRIQNKKPLVYLQHGIVAMKKISYGDNSYNGSMKMFVVSSENEKKLMMTQNNMTADLLKVTGLPRYDSLTVKMTEKKIVLFMPTWRDWLNKDEETFKESSFYKNYRELLKSEEFLSILRKHDAVAQFYPHFEIENRFSHLLDFESERVKVVSYSDTYVQDIVRTSTVLVTDYSSIAWDFIYLGKPVIFYQFDRKQYLLNRGSYVDLKRDLPGEIAMSKQNVIENVERYLENDGGMSGEYRKRAESYYEFHDQNNSDRVYRAIVKLETKSKSSE